MIELAFAGILLVGAAGSGRRLLRLAGYRAPAEVEDWCFAVALGLAGLMLATLFLGLVHLLYTGVILAVVGFWALWGGKELVPYLSAVRQSLPRLHLHKGDLLVWLAAAAGLGLVFNLVQAMTPPHGSTDPLAYQLALPKLFLARHYLSFEPTITGALYPSNMGLLYVVAIALRNGILAQIVHWLMGALTCVAVFGFAQRYVSREAGVWGAVLFSFFPVLVFFGPKGYIDVGLCFFQFMAFWALFNWLDGGLERRQLVLAAVLAGIAMGIKHQGMATAVLGGGIVLGGQLLLRRDLRAALIDALLFAGIALLIVAPWYGRAYYFADNPLWPLANGFFDGYPYGYKPVLWDDYAAHKADKSWLATIIPSTQWLVNYSKSISPWEWTFRPSGWQKAIGVYFVALLPGLLLYARSKRLYLLFGFCFAYYLVLARILHANPRYGMVLFAFLCVLAGHVAAQAYRHRHRVLGYVFAGGLVASFCLNLIWQYTLARPALEVAVGLESREHFLQAREGNYRVFSHVNRHLPDDSLVLLQGIVKGYYCDRFYLWDHPYQKVIDYDDFDSSQKLLAHMRQLNISHIVRMINIPPSRRTFFPQYFLDEFHEDFRKRHLKLLYHDESYALFEVKYDS